MSQSVYGLNQAAAMLGMKADAEFDLVESLIAEEVIGLGLGLVKANGNDSGIRKPMARTTVITDDAGTYTAGAIVVTVNGVTATAAYTTDKNTTLTALAAAIQALASVATAVYNSGAHTITITAEDNLDLGAVTVDISAITGTMTISSTAIASSDTLFGVSLQTHRLVQDVNGLVAYPAKDAVNVLRKGKVWVNVEEAVTPASTVHFRFLDNGASKLRGMFRTDTDSGKATAITNAKFRSTTTGAGMAILEINQP